MGRELHAGGRKGDVPGGEIGLRPLGEGERRAGAAFEHERRPIVVQVDNGPLAHGEQLCLGGGVFAHRLVKIEVVLRQVGKHPHREAYPRHAVQHERMAGHLHHHVRAAGVRHLPEELLQLVALGRGALGVDELRADHVAVGADEAHFGVARDLQQQLQQIGRGRLAVGAGDADDRHLRGRVAEEVAGHQRQRLAAVLHQHIGDIRLRRGFAYGALRAEAGGRGYVLVPVGLKAAYGHERRPRRGPAGVVADVAELQLHVRAHFLHAHVFQKVPQLQYKAPP